MILDREATWRWRTINSVPENDDRYAVNERCEDYRNLHNGIATAQRSLRIVISTFLVALVNAIFASS